MICDDMIQIYNCKAYTAYIKKILLLKLKNVYNIIIFWFIFWKVVLMEVKSKTTRFMGEKQRRYIFVCIINNNIVSIIYFYLPRSKKINRSLKNWKFIFFCAKNRFCARIRIPRNIIWLSFIFNNEVPYRGHLFFYVYGIQSWCIPRIIHIF